jgi:hypothetical protein
VNSKKKEWLTEKKEEEKQEEKEEVRATLDSYFIKNKADVNKLHH